MNDSLEKGDSGPRRRTGNREVKRLAPSNSRRKKDHIRHIRQPQTPCRTNVRAAAVEMKAKVMMNGSVQEKNRSRSARRFDGIILRADEIV